MCGSQLLTCISQQTGLYRLSQLLHHRHKLYWTCIYIIFLQVCLTYGEDIGCTSQNTSVPVGANVTMCCIWKKNESVFWTLDNKIIINNMTLTFVDKNRFKVIANGNFMILNVNKGDAGNYGCTSGNNYRKIILDVLLPPGTPEITGKLIYDEGDQISLTCTSTGGNPPPQLYWVSNNKNYSDKTSHNGAISSIDLKIAVNRTFNGQQIACYAENIVNRNNPVEIKKTLNVHYAPSVKITPDYNPYKVVEGKSLTIMCHIDSNPEATSADLRQGNKSLKRASASELSSKRFSYQYPSVVPSNSGVFTCVVINLVGNKTENWSLDVLYKPKLSVTPKVVVNITDPVQFECTSNANPKAQSIFWNSSPGAMISSFSSTSSKLEIKVAAKSNAGNYTCVATSRMQPSSGNGINARSTAVTMLFVQYAPGNTEVVSNSVPIKGAAPISLTCLVNVNHAGYPPPTYTWRREGKTIRQGNSSPLLTIDQPRLSDNGHYTCTAQNLMGSGTVGSTIVTVKEYPEIKTRLPERLVQKEKATLSPLRCVAYGDPTPTIVWHKDGELVSAHMYKVVNFTNTKNTVTSMLYFNGTTQESKERPMPFDTGNYSCVVKTSLNNQFQTKSTLLLIVQSAPYIKEAYKTIAISLKTNSSISLEILAYPKPDFSWSKANTPIKPVTTQININTFRSSLIFPYATTDNLGVYICTVNNSIGGLLIKRDVRKRSVPDPPSNVGSLEATWESVYLQWDPGFNGGENQTFLIFKSLDNNGRSARSLDVPIGQTVTPHFNVTGLMPNTKYIFRVRAWNKLGNGSFSKNLDVQTQSINFPVPQNVKYYESKKRVEFEMKSEYNCCASLQIDRRVTSLWCNTTLSPMKNNTLTIGYSEVLKLEVRLCLRQRPNLCGEYVEAIRVNKKMSENSLSTMHMIVIAVVCSVILVILVVVLILFLYWRNKSQKKHYGNEVNYPNMSNGRVGNGVPSQQVYENPDGPFTNGYIENKHNTSSEHTDELPPYTDNDIGHELSDESDPEKPYDTFRNDNANHEEPPTYSEACRNPAEKPGDLSFYNHPQSPTRNMNFVSLNPDGLPRDTSTSGRESGYSTPDSSRPKKVIYEVIV